MSLLLRLGTIMISLSLAVMLGHLMFYASSAYYSGVMGFTDYRYGVYLAYLYNKETKVLVDLKENSKVGLIIMNQAQIQNLISNNRTLYFACFNFTGSLDETLGRIDQGLYVLIFDSTDKDQEARFQIIQNGLELDLMSYSAILFFLGIILILLQLLRPFVKRELK
ncbi:MAG: hypothetical protein FGF48_06320 [Candidatus Brockarchaeota archaeon]|nr:hypothetical protein [Candidatus Brockarchaeota archaeon]